MRTDKDKSGLFAEYEKLFADLKDKPIKYLEVGVAYGDSMMWAQGFFPKASLFGIDIIEPKIFPLKGIFEKINQNDTKQLIQFGITLGDFDIIIDDASHLAKETENTFRCLYPFLKKGGLYIIEDWSAGFSPRFPETKGLEVLVEKLIIERVGSLHTTKEYGSYAVVKKVRDL